MLSRKIISLFLVISLFVSLSACGEESANSSTDRDPNLPVITIALRDGIYSDVIIESLPKFETANNCYVDALLLSEDELHSMVVEDAENAAGQYDLCMVDGSWMAEYTQKGVLLNLSDAGYKLDEDIIPATTQICFYNGDVYLAPYYGNVTVLLYNKQLIEKAGYSGGDIDSLDDILDICQKTQDDGNFGFMYRGDSNNNYVVDFLPILLSYGGWVVDDNNAPTVNTPEFKAAMEYYLELIGTGKAESRDELIMAIANGAAAMGVGWPGWYTPHADSAADYSAITGQVHDGDIAYNANVYGIWTIGVPANSSNSELGLALLQYLMDPKNQYDTIESGGVPCRYSCLRDYAVLERFPQYAVVCEALEGGVYRPVMAEWTDFYTILGEEMGLIINGDKSLDDGLFDAQERLEEML